VPGVPRPSVASTFVSLAAPAIGEDGVSFPGLAGNDPRKTPVTISAFYAPTLFKRFFIGAPSIEGDLTALSVGGKKMISSEHV
jgi:hypothetical protein